MINAAPQERENYLNASYGLKSWLLTKDHKRIGLLYLATITLFFFIGGSFELTRAEYRAQAPVPTPTPQNHPAPSLPALAAARNHESRGPRRVHSSGTTRRTSQEENDERRSHHCHRGWSRSSDRAAGAAEPCGPWTPVRGTP